MDVVVYRGRGVGLHATRQRLPFKRRLSTASSRGELAWRAGIVERLGLPYILLVAPHKSCARKLDGLRDTRGSICTGQRIQYDGWDAATTFQDWTRPRPAHLVSILLSVAPPQCESRNAKRTVSRRHRRISFGRNKKCGLRRAVLCCAVVGICKDPICQVEPTPTASVQKTRNAASLCYIQT